MSDAFKFGAWERIWLSIMGMVVWPIIVALMYAVVSQHGNPTPEFGEALDILIYVGIFAIAMCAWGRPLSVLLGRIWGRIKRGWRARVPDPEEVDA